MNTRWLSVRQLGIYLSDKDIEAMTPRQRANLYHRIHGDTNRSTYEPKVQRRLERLEAMTLDDAKTVAIKALEELRQEKKI